MQQKLTKALSYFIHFLFSENHQFFFKHFGVIKETIGKKLGIVKQYIEYSLKLTSFLKFFSAVIEAIRKNLAIVEQHVEFFRQLAFDPRP